MTRKITDQRQSEIISRYYRGKYDPQTERRIRDKFMLWLKENRQSAQAQEILKELFEAESGDPSSVTAERIDQIMQRIGLDVEQEALKGHQGNVGLTKTLRRITMRVAAIVIPFVIILGIWHSIGVKEPIEQFAWEWEWTIPNGQIRTVDLPDSSAVTISAGSVLNIKQDGDKREANLKGESYFNIAPDQKRPFIVKTADLTVTVLGTEFNVEAYPESNYTIVTLAKGSISLDLPDGTNYQLTPNQQLIYDKNTARAQVVVLDNLDASLAWKMGRIVYDMKTIPQMLKTIERRFNVELRIDPNLKFSQMKYTTEFGSEVTVDRVLESLRIVTEEFDYKIEGNVVIISHPTAVKH